MENEEIKVGMSLEDVRKEQLEPGMVFGDEKYDCMQIILKIGKKIKFIKIKKMNKVYLLLILMIIKKNIIIKV